MQVNFTKVPNILFDQLLNDLTYSELKIILVIIRQTNGYVDKQNKRKLRDRITYNQFKTKTGLSRRAIGGTIKGLNEKRLVEITDRGGNSVNTPNDRRGNSFLFYSFIPLICANNDTNMCTLRHQHVQNRIYNKRKDIKRKETKEISYQHIGEIINKMESK
jgi:hypothetical protein